jgi:outer membrane protein assembly factor BamB
MRRSAPLVLAFLGGFTALAIAEGLADDWSQWRGSDRNGVAASSPPLIESIPAEGLEPLWVSEPIKAARQGGWSSPVAASGRVYLFAHEREQVKEPGPRKFPWLPEDKRGGMTAEEYQEYERNRRLEDQERAKLAQFREHVYCLDAETGKTLWHNRSESVYSRFPQSGSPTVQDGRLYILGAGRNLRCLAAETGDDIWTTRLPGEFEDEHYQSSVLLIDGLAVVMAGRLMAVDAESGQLAWDGDAKTSSGSHSSPVAWASPAGDRIIVNLNGGQTGCFNPQTGERIWAAKTEGGLATPIVQGNLLITYGNSRQKGLRCFRMTEEGAEELWLFRGAQDKGSSPVIVDGHVYVQGERRVACVDLETGEADWTGSLDLASPQFTSLIAADGKVFYAYDGLTAFRATPEGFEPFVQAKFNAAGLMASEDTHRALLNLDQIEKEENGLEKSMRIMDREVNRHGPHKCATPAIADGRLYLRMPEKIVCYDLRTPAARAAAENGE